jgi:hypothetical protein
MTDPFAKAAVRIIHRVGDQCVFTRYSDSERVPTVAVLDRDVEIIDELGNVIDRDDMVSLIVADVGVPKSRDTVHFSELDLTYRLGRTIRDDGYVAKMLAHKNA